MEAMETPNFIDSRDESISNFIEIIISISIENLSIKKNLPHQKFLVFSTHDELRGWQFKTTGTFFHKQFSQPSCPSFQGR